MLFETLEDEPLENGEVRQVLRIKPFLAPYKVNVLPLIKKTHGAKAAKIYSMLKKHFMASYDDTGSIGKRYRRGDAIGTPFAVTIDNDTLEKNTVTLRERDSMRQIFLPADDLAEYISKAVSFAG